MTDLDDNVVYEFVQGLRDVEGPVDAGVLAGLVPVYGLAPGQLSNAYGPQWVTVVEFARRVASASGPALDHMGERRSSGMAGTVDLEEWTVAHAGRRNQSSPEELDWVVAGNTICQFAAERTTSTVGAGTMTSSGMTRGILDGVMRSAVYDAMSAFVTAHRVSGSGLFTPRMYEVLIMPITGTKLLPDVSAASGGTDTSTSETTHAGKGAR